MYNKRKLKFPILVIGDMALFYVALFSMLFIRYPVNEIMQEFTLYHAIPFTIIFFIWILVFISLGLYEVRITKNEYAFIERIVQATITNAVVGVIFFYGIPAFQITPRVNLSIVLLFTALFIFVWRYIFNGIIAHRNADRVLFFGLSEDVQTIAKYLKANPQYTFQPIAYISTDTTTAPFQLEPIYPLDHNLKELVQKFSIDTIVTSKEITDNKILVRALFEILPLGVTVIDFPVFYEIITGKIPVYSINELWFLENFVKIKNTLYERVHRAFDIVLTIVFFVPYAILFPCIAMAIALESNGPILYRQKRIGKGGVEIEIIKFRSMIANAETGNALWADENDPRVTRVGTFLRKTRFDELPQLLNILKGEMSFVGPRPERPEFVKLLEKKIPFYDMRHMVMPGLTGWAQINFPYGASIEDAMEKLQYDLYYIKHRSLSLDFDILLRTIVVVLSRTGR